MAGTYGVESELLFTSLIGQHLPTDARAIAWGAFSLQGNADTALAAIVTHAREGADTIRLRRGVAYRCVNGWLAPTLAAEGLAGDGTERAVRGAERGVFVASARDGALVARLRTTIYRELPVWCGNGCSGVRLPFSATTRVRWERAAPLAGEFADIDLDDPQRYLDPRETRARSRIRGALPLDVVLVGVTPQADGWHVSIDVVDKTILVSLLTTLNNTSGIADARLERACESLNLEGSWHEVIWLRFTSRRARTVALTGGVVRRSFNGHTATPHQA